MTGVKRGWLAAAGVLATALSISSVHAGEAKWHPWIEAGGTLSTERDRGEVTGFAPLLQDSNSLLFADVKGKLFSESVKEGNFALGYRRMTAPGWNLGVWGGYDIRESTTDNTFGQVAFGVEALSADYDFRLNGYVPTTDPKAAGGLATVTISGTQILMTGGREVPLAGFDGELGWRVPIERMGADPDRHEFRLFAGGYRFDDSDLSEPVQGPRLRTEWRVNDVIPGFAGSRLTLGGAFQHDDYRDDQWEIGFRLRIPLYSSDAPQKLSPIERRMSEALVRDADIVTAPSRTERVADALTGVTFDRVARVDGTGDLQAVSIIAGTNSLIIVEGGNGDVGDAVIGGDQTLAGTGSTIALRGVSSGTVANFFLPGTTPRLRSQGCSCDEILELVGSNIHLTGLLLDGQAGSSDAGIFMGDSLTNLHFTNLEIREAWEGIGGNDFNEIFVNNVRFYENLYGIRLNDENTLSVTNSILDVHHFGGIYVADENVVTITNVRITDVDAGSAVRLDDLNTLTVNGLAVEEVWDSAIEGDTGNTIVATNLAARETGWHAINLNTFNSFSLTGGTIEETANDGVSGIGGNEITLSGVTFRNIGLSAIYIEDDNTLSVSDSTFEGTVVEDILTVGGTTNTLSGSGNENTANVGNNLCTAAPGSFTGTIGFDGSADIVDGSCP